jgi:glycosyltransferase involved in cell wall biosynthesis
VRIAILLATLNGAEFLGEQLASLANQTVPALDIVAADDGSVDGTVELLEEASRFWPKGSFRLIEGARAGSPAANFRHLILSLEGDYDFVAFSDQDDVWLPAKLEHAAKALGEHDGPVVHCARTALIDRSGRSIGLSPLFRRTPDFRNALVQSLAGGNTMVMNRAAFALVRNASGRTSFVAHDWWVYQIVSGAGGTMLYSSSPDTLYRQHADNDVGANVGFIARVTRVGALLGGRFRRWNEVNLEALSRCEDLLTKQASCALRAFGAARSGRVLNRWRALKSSGAFRQTIAGQVSLYVACLLNLL